MTHFSNEIKDFNNISSDCETIIFVEELNFNLTNLPSSCSSVILTNSSLKQLNFLKKLPHNCFCE